MSRGSKMNEKQAIAWMIKELRYRIKNYPDRNDYHEAIRDTCTELLRGMEARLGMPLPKNKGYCYWCHKEVHKSHFKNLSTDPKEPEYFCDLEIRAINRMRKRYK